MNKGELRILIVDDDPEDILLTESLLREGLKGVAIEVDKAGSFTEGVSHVERAHYDVCFFDYQLGEKTGLDLVRCVRNKGVDTPVVFLAGQGGEEVAVEVMKLGAADYLPKSRLTENLIRRSVHYAIGLYEKEKLRQQEQEELRQMNHKLENSVKALERHNRKTSLLSKLDNILDTCINVDEAYAVITKHVPELFSGQSGALCVFDRSRNLVESTAVWGDNPPNNQEFLANECWALRRGYFYWVRDSSREIVCPHLRGTPWKGHLCVPMMAHGETLGVMVVQGRAPAASDVEEEQIGNPESERQFAETLTEHLALALANLRLLEALRVQSVRDPLTGLFNRRYMEESLGRALSAASRRCLPVAVVMLDLDRFKECNDSHGHSAGDALLREFGDFLQSHVRGEDIACRYGGDEFVLVFPEAAVCIAERRADEIRCAFKNLARREDGVGSITMTLSIGIAAAPEHGLSSRVLLEAADASLYRAKSEGGDRVITAKAPITRIGFPVSPQRARAHHLGGKS
jgi:diguanylate cyclase (GGDEF)-like protein